MKLFYEKFIKWEKYFFLLLVFIHLLPVFAVDFFVTHDGPAHVYNASLIARILFQDTISQQFLMLNPHPEPNWIGHFILAVLQQFFPGNISEKILLCVYIVSLPLGFRKFILTINPQASWASYLIFPFIHSFLLYMGFYNFCLGLPVLFYTLAYWSSLPGIFHLKKVIVCSFLLVLLYFSHLFVLLIFFLTAGLFLCMNFFERLKKGDAKIIYKKTGLLFVSALPVVLLTANFLLQKANHQDMPEEHSSSELAQWILSARPLVTFKNEGELPFAIVVAVTTGLLLFNLIYSLLRKNYSSAANPLLLLLVVLAGFYFLIPDNFATGGFVSMRLVLVFYLFLFAAFASAEIFPLMKIFSVIVFLSVSIYFLKYHYDIEKILSADAKEYYSLAEKMEKNSVTLPLFYSDNWMHNNLAAYMGTKPGIFVLDNYEPYKPHFPLLWKQGKVPSEIIGDLGNYSPCIDIDKFETETKTKIDYIARWHFNPAIIDSCTLAVLEKLENDFERIYVSSSGAAELFKRKI